MNISRILAILLAISCVGLGAATLNLVQQNRQLNSQLVALDAARQATMHGEWDPERSERRGGLRQALEAEQEANVELREELAKLKGEPVPPKQSSPPPVPENSDAPRGNRDGGGGGPDAWLERIRQQDPERYKQVV